MDSLTPTGGCQNGIKKPTGVSAWWVVGFRNDMQSDQAFFKMCHAMWQSLSASMKWSSRTSFQT
jgi:hypothetical protein